MSPRKNTASQKPAKKNKKHNTFTSTVFKFIIVIVILVSCAVAGIVGGAVIGYVKMTPPITDEQLQIKIMTSFVYDSQNKVIAEINGTENKNRILVYDKQVPKYIKDAFVAIEDQRFYQHNGIDIRRIGSAVLSVITNGKAEHGGSTITQQVVRNITGETERTMQRKIQEQWRAMQLENQLEKWQILELYMNVIYMGENCYGVQSAARTYFNKDVWDLSLAECASLAGITNLPARYDPFTDQGRKNNKERQQLILKKMLDLDYITDDEYDKAINEKLNFISSDKSISKTVSKQTYFVDQVINDVLKDLVASGMNRDVALQTIYNYGLKIYSTADSDVQKAMDEVYNNPKYFPLIHGQSGEHPQSSMVIIDPKTGQVKALYGGYGEKKGSTLNRASQISRQPGSSFKPIAVYGPAINERKITAATVLDDVPVYMLGYDKGRYPQNYDTTYYGGLTTIRNGIKNSINVVAAKVWKDMLGPDLSLSYLKKVGINRDNERYVSIAMGGLNKGVNTLQMASAYVPFVNKGVYFEPTTYTRVEDRNGNVILEKKAKSNIVYDEAAAYIMANMMEDVCKSGTANPYGIVQGGRIASAGKTGTTSDNIDKWFVGYTPYLVGATWYGYDNKTSPIKLQPEEYNQSLKIWNAVMDKAHAKLPSASFTIPAGVVKKKVCIYSGKTPSNLCQHDQRGSSIREEFFISGTEPSDTDVCDLHVYASVCKDSKDNFGRHLLFDLYCPQSSKVDNVFIKRKVPLSGDTYPKDMRFEVPTGLYCNVHGEGNIINPLETISNIAESAIDKILGEDTNENKPKSTEEPSKTNNENVTESPTPKVSNPLKDLIKDSLKKP